MFDNLNTVGNRSLLSSEFESKRFAFAGPRRGLRTESIEWLKDMVSKLTPNHVIVSGLAIGSDTIVHRTALELGIPQIAVLPSGLDNVYPRHNRKLAKDILNDGGLLVSELPNHCPPSRSSFINRNKIIAELGHMLIVPQFEAKSGTRHTVDFAKDLDKFIIVQTTSDSGNKLIAKNHQYKALLK